MRSPLSLSLALLALVAGFGVAPSAFAQGAPPAPVGQPAAAVPGQTMVPTSGTPATPTTNTAVAGPVPDTGEHLPDLVRATPGALTADQVAKRAAQTSYSARAAEAGIRAAAARVDAAWANFVPRINGRASYQRLSDFKPFTFGTLTIANILDNYALEATVIVPISDYFLRINQSYTAATHAETAAKFDLVTAKAKSAADGRVAYYNWLTSRASLVVAEATLDLQKTLVKDAQNQFTVGNASKSDVLQAESAVAAAELAVEHAKNLLALTERQVRIAIHASEDERIVPGEDFESDVPPFQGNLAELVREGNTSRYEIKSIDANADAALSQAKAARWGRYPSLSASGDALYANPNARRFPPSDEWFGTWAVGAQVTWSPNDILAANAGGNEAEARAEQLIAQKGAVRDGIELEITEAWQNVKEAEFAYQTTKRQLESAAEGYRVARELFTHGRSTATQVREAETTFTRGRLDNLNARAQARTARVRLEHAVGRDSIEFAR